MGNREQSFGEYVKNAYGKIGLIVRRFVQRAGFPYRYFRLEKADALATEVTYRMSYNTYPTNYRVLHPTILYTIRVYTLILHFLVAKIDMLLL